MKKSEALALIELLSALESWALSCTTDRQIPVYLHEEICERLADLRKIVLGEEE